MSKDYEVLAQYLTSEQLRDLLASWRQAGMADAPEVTEIKRAIESLEG